ncbi:unnamed protein product [Amoebophrya sp. A25]|nr:unnamed protein product [Amoebophrya sp. A25]|eukprot:GSA25T00015426001.1
MIYALYIFYRGQVCIYEQRFFANDKDGGTSRTNAKLIYGLLSTMKSLAQQVSLSIKGPPPSVSPGKNNLGSTTTAAARTSPGTQPSSGGGTSASNSGTNSAPPSRARRDAQSRSKLQAFNSFTTASYKLHCLEIPTGYFFVCTTPPNALWDMRDHLRHVYQTLFVPYVLRHPSYDIGAPVATLCLDEEERTEDAQGAKRGQERTEQLIGGTRQGGGRGAGGSVPDLAGGGGIEVYSYSTANGAPGVSSKNYSREVYTETRFGREVSAFVARLNRNSNYPQPQI